MNAGTAAVWDLVWVWALVSFVVADVLHGLLRPRRRRNR